MAPYFVRKRSFREVRRFQLSDAQGVKHTIVERIETRHGVGASGRVFDAEEGITRFHSATTGDVLVQQPNGLLKSADGQLEFHPDAEIK